MAINVTCPGGHSFRVKASYAGRSGRCPECGETVVVPYEQAPTWQPSAEDTSRAGKGADVSAWPTMDRLRPGQRLGRFEVLAAVGRGAFGAVFRAHDPQLDREVALKIPRSGLLDDDADVNRFMREARAAGQLRHPNIVPVYDAGQIEGTYYIASGFIDGCTLEMALEDRATFAPREAAALVAKVATALHYAHSQGIIHRDIKPANIMIDMQGEPHVMDFGLARRLTGEAARTVEGTRMGTPAYMSLEQAEGQSHLADERSDLWSLGVVLYELLTGKLPFDGSEIDVLVALLTKEPMPLRQRDSTLPKDLETICLKCLRRERNERYPSCRHLADELTRFLTGEPIVARRIAVWERAARWVRRNQVVAALGALVLAISVTFAVVATHIAGRLSRQQAITQQSLRDAQQAAAVAETALSRLQQETRARTEAEADRIAADQETAAEQERRLAAEARSKELSSNLTAATQSAESAEAARAAAEERRQAAEQTAQEAAQRQAAPAADALQSYAIKIDAAEQAMLQDRLKDMEQLLEECDPVLRSWEWRFLRNARQPSRELVLPAASNQSSFHVIEFFDDDRRILTLASKNKSPGSYHAWDLTESVSTRRKPYWSQKSLDSHPYFHLAQWFLVQVTDRNVPLGHHMYRAWNLAKNEELPRVEGYIPRAFYRNSGLVLAQTSDWGPSATTDVHCLSLSSRYTQWKISPPAGSAFDVAPPRGITMSSQGNFFSIAAKNYDGRAQDKTQIRETNQGSLLIEVEGYPSVAFSQIDDVVALGKVVWNLKTKEKVKEFAGLPPDFPKRFVGYQDYLLVNCADGFQLWDYTSTRLCGTIQCRGERAEYLHAGRVLAVGNRQQLTAFDAASGELCFESPVFAWQPTRDGKRIICVRPGKNGRAVDVLDARTGRRLLTLGKGHDALSISADGSRIAASQPDGSVVVWTATAR